METVYAQELIYVSIHPPKPSDKNLTSKTHIDLPRMACHRNISTLITLEHIIKRNFCPPIFFFLRLTESLLPEWIIFYKPILELPIWKLFVDLSFAASTITCMSTDTLTEKLFNEGFERTARWEGKTRKCDFRGLETPD
jgi:hypothetical protein